MFTTQKITAAHAVGSIVAFDEVLGAWGLAQDGSSLVGVVSGEPFEHEGALYAPVTFGGVAFALAARDIPPQGGGLAIENGRAYVGALALDRAGEVAPLSFDQAPPSAGDLILIFLR